MIKSIQAALAAIFSAALVLAAPAFAQQVPSYIAIDGKTTVPVGVNTPMPVTSSGGATAASWTPVSTVAISPTNVSAATALPSADAVILVQNRGPRVVFAKLGTAGVTATATDMPIMPGSAVVLAAGANTYIGLLNQNGGTGSTGLVYVTTGTGTPNLSGDTSMVSNQDPLEGNGKDRFVPIVGVDHWKAVFRGLALDTAALNDKSAGVLAANIPYTETSTPLTSGSTYTGNSRQAKYQPSNLDDGYAFAAVTFRANIIADQAGNCWLEHSPNGSTWYKATAITAITASVPVTITVATTTYAYRVVCTNGGTNQGSFFVSSSFATR